MPNLLLGTDDETWGLLVAERTQTLEISAGTFELDIFAHNVLDIDSALNLFDSVHVSSLYATLLVTARLCLNMGMNENGTPPAPPPITPQKPVNPYDFLEDKPRSKKPLLPLPSGNSKVGRLIVVGVGVVLLFIIGMIVMAILSAPGQAATKDLVLAAQQQNELIRVADIGAKGASSPDIRNLAVNTKLTLSTDQSKLLAIVNKSKKVDAKVLALGKDNNTDRVLTAAKQSNRFDEVFKATLKKELAEYSNTLKRVHDNSSNSTNKQILADQYSHVVQLYDSIPAQ